MGVYIKGIKMPDSCWNCPLLDSEYGVCDILDTEATGLSRHKDCPLVAVPEPHGALIDRDMLEQELRNGIKAGNLEEGYEHYANINSMDDCVECVRYADTVIEAEGE